MARHADPALENRILDAARKLWKKGGEKALTMRAVAQAAGTTTPTVYQRFPSREHILLGLLRQIQLDFTRIVQESHSPEEICQRYLDFALTHPQEYQLFFAHQESLHREAQRRRSHPEESRPGVEAAKRRLAEWMGGSPEDYTELHLGLWALLHGTAMLLISQTTRDGLAQELRESSTKAITALLQELAPRSAAKRRR